MELGYKSDRLSRLRVKYLLFAPAFIPAGQSFNIQIIGGPTPSTTVYGEMIWNIRIDMIPWLAERCGGTPIFLNIAARTNLQAVAEARGFIMHNIGTL